MKIRAVICIIYVVIAFIWYMVEALKQPKGDLGYSHFVPSIQLSIYLIGGGAILLLSKLIF